MKQRKLINKKELSNALFIITFSLLLNNCSRNDKYIYQGSYMPLNFKPIVNPQIKEYQQMETYSRSLQQPSNIFVGVPPKTIYINPARPNIKRMPKYERETIKKLAEEQFFEDIEKEDAVVTEIYPVPVDTNNASAEKISETAEIIEAAKVPQKTIFEIAEYGTLEELNEALKNSVSSEVLDKLLMLASKNNPDAAIIDVLIKAGADINVRDNGFSPLIIAAMNNPNPEIIKALVRAGADINDSDTQFGLAAVVWANDNNPDPETIVDVFMELGATK